MHPFGKGFVKLPAIRDGKASERHACYQRMPPATLVFIEATDHYLHFMHPGAKTMAKQHTGCKLRLLPRLVINLPGKRWKRSLIQGNIEVRSNPRAGKARVNIAAAVDRDGPLAAAAIPASKKHTFLRENRPLIVHRCNLSSEPSCRNLPIARWLVHWLFAHNRLRDHREAIASGALNRAILRATPRRRTRDTKANH